MPPSTTLTRSVKAGRDEQRRPAVPHAIALHKDAKRRASNSLLTIRSTSSAEIVCPWTIMTLPVWPQVDNASPWVRLKHLPTAVSQDRDLEDTCVWTLAGRIYD